MRPVRPAGLAALAAAGLVIAGYLTAFQLGLLGTVWDPVFGTGSERVLTSAAARLLPVPDASLGALAYAADLVLAVALAARVGPSRPIAGLLAGIASLGGLASIGLIGLQAFVVDAFCSLCIASAALSIVLAVGALAEARDALGPADQATRARSSASPSLKEAHR